MKEVIRIFLAMLLIAASAQARTHECAPDGVGLGGYDPVSYLDPGGPVRGAREFEATHAGLRYRFSSPENRDRFLAGPVEFLPRYNGFCAATLAVGRLVCPDYTNFKIEDGDLLLFELTGFTNGRTLWNSDPAGYRARADENALILLEQ